MKDRFKKVSVSRSSSFDDIYAEYERRYDHKEKTIESKYGAEMHASKAKKDFFRVLYLDTIGSDAKMSASRAIDKIVMKQSTSISIKSMMKISGGLTEALKKTYGREFWDDVEAEYHELRVQGKTAEDAKRYIAWHRFGSE